LNHGIEALDRKAQNTYSLDPRIYELERKAEEAYEKWKNEQNKINERRDREKVLKESFSRLQNEKEQLRKELQKYERQNQEENNETYNQSKVFHYMKSSSVFLVSLFGKQNGVY